MTSAARTSGESSGCSRSTLTVSAIDDLPYRGYNRFRCYGDHAIESVDGTLFSSVNAAGSARETRHLHNTVTSSRRCEAELRNRCPEDSNNGCADRNREVHGSTVIGHGNRASAENLGRLEQCQLPC